MQIKGKLLDNSLFEQEFLSGTVDGVNQVFTLSFMPHSAKAVLVFLNLPQKQGTDYTISGQTVTFSAAPAVGQKPFAFYVKR